MNLTVLLTTVSQTALMLLADIGPLLQDNAKVQQVITTLEQLIPFATTVGLDLIQPIQNAIAVLQGADSLTADQVTQLNNLKSSADAAYQAAWAPYSAAHPDPGAASA